MRIAAFHPISATLLHTNCDAIVPAHSASSHVAVSQEAPSVVALDGVNVEVPSLKSTSNPILTGKSASDDTMGRIAVNLFDVPLPP